MRGSRVFIFSVFVLGLIWAPSASAQAPAPQSTGGAGFESEKPKPKAGARVTALVPGAVATIGADGLATAPLQAPAEVHAAINAANQIVGKPYKYGGGHARVNDSGYDCSGTVSYALLGAGLLDDPLDSSSFMRWGASGPGRWFTVYTNPGHAFAVIAGLRLDTSAANDPRGTRGPRWRPALRSTRGFRARHIDGF